MEESERARRDDDEIRDDLGRELTPADLGATSVVIQTKAVGAYPTAAGRFYACTILDIFGPEGEGTNGSQLARGNTIYALHTGRTAPPQGTTAVATFVGRWVFRYD